MREINELIQKRDAGLAQHMTRFARNTFRTNRERISEGDKRALLKHLGLGGDVYTCMLLPAGAECRLAPFSIERTGESWDYHIVKLTSDEAAIFESTREWFEGMATLRVGGDDRPEW